MEFIQSLCVHFQNFFSWSTLRGLSVVLASVFVYVANVIADFSHPSMPFLFALLVFDFTFGAGIALHKNRFTWSGFTHGLAKFLAYALIFVVTGFADAGLGSTKWALNLTVAVSVYAIAGESISCLKHIEFMFPGLLPSWIIERLTTLRMSVEMGKSGRQRRRDDWRGEWTTQGDEYTRSVADVYADSFNSEHHNAEREEK